MIICNNIYIYIYTHTHKIRGTSRFAMGALRRADVCLLCHLHLLLSLLAVGCCTWGSLVGFIQAWTGDGMGQKLETRWFFWGISKPELGMGMGWDGMGMKIYFCQLWFEHQSIRVKRFIDSKWSIAKAQIKALALLGGVVLGAASWQPGESVEVPRWDVQIYTSHNTVYLRFRIV